MLCTGGNMWISADESEVISATLLPKLKKTWRAHEDLLFEAITLQVHKRPVPSCYALAGAYGLNQ